MDKKDSVNFRSLETIPIDVRKIIVKEQNKVRESRGIARFSISSTIIKIIREWNSKCNQS